MSRYGALFENINIAIFDWLHTAMNVQPNGSVLLENDPLAIPVFQAESDVIRPDDKAYVEWDFLSGVSKIGSIDELLNATANTYKLRGQREFSISVNFIGTGAAELAVLAQQSLDSPGIQDILRLAGLSVRGTETIADQTTFLETSFEERAVLDVILGLAIELSDSVSSIESVEVTSTLPGGDTRVIS